jgi:hypothetical protein
LTFIDGAGATTFQPWKDGMLEPSGCGVCHALQWGHDFSAVERCTPCTSPEKKSMLQWGHDFSAVERCTPCTSPEKKSEDFEKPFLSLTLYTINTII